MNPTIGGTWYNQHGSELNIAIDEEGLIRGGFRTAVGFSSGEQSLVTGFATGDLLSFVAEFTHHGCLTAWVGHYLVQDGLELLETLWHMVGMAPDSPAGKDVWRSTWSGADMFHRGPPDRATSEGSMPSHPTGYRRG